MCNCGRKRDNYTQQLNTPGENNFADTQMQDATYFNFQYTGKTALTVTGNFTQNRYRFNFPGDVQPIHSKDAAGMMSLPVLRRTR